MNSQPRTPASSPYSSYSPASPGCPHSPAPVPGPCPVPEFAPLRVSGGRHRLRRAVRRRRRAVVAGLAVTAAALAASAPRDSGAPGPRAHAPVPSGTPGEPDGGGRGRPVEVVSAPVRIADAATVRLLRPGDRVDVIAAAGPAAGGGGAARVVAAGARVAEVPGAGADPPEGGALVVLSVPRATAAALAGAGATSQLAVTLC
ncbi:hypothetical protein ABT160_39890 [Streptomyces sp. NPDC001941]|uniref:hypothetical protein n=1 Tax=Streptomyces sp. NPDC001941 TaxID=3154659 RepID=UPI00332D1DA6